MRHGPFLALLVFLNEKAWLPPSPSQLQTPSITAIGQSVCLPDSLDLDPLPIDFLLGVRRGEGQYFALTGGWI